MNDAVRICGDCAELCDGDCKNCGTNKKSVSFRIDEQLPSLNDYINRLKAPNGKYAGAKFKREVDDLISWFIVKDREKIAEVCKNPVVIYFDWHEKSYRRDVDNVYSAKKYILDAMQKTKVLQNDSPKFVRDVKDSIHYDDKDFVIVTIKEV